MKQDDWIFVTGATGLVGGAVLDRLLEERPDRSAYVLVRDAARWQRTVRSRADARAWRWASERVIPVEGDLTRPGLGLGAADRRALLRRVRMVIHAAADTCFSRPLEEARRVNRDGTANLLDLWATCTAPERFVHVSTAFVAGRRTGWVREDDPPAAAWVNAYERSKHEAEELVRKSGLPWLIARPSTIVCDDPSGRVSQVNAVHRALHLHRAGLASLLPGSEESLMDLVPNDYVSRAVAALALRPGLEGRTFHLCAGSGALPLGELLDRAHEAWSEEPEWRRRGVARPALTDLETYRLFEATVRETGDPRLRRITRSFSHFVPQLALPKRFDTGAADELLGMAAPPVRTYWTRLLRDLRDRVWSTGREAFSRPA